MDKRTAEFERAERERARQRKEKQDGDLTMLRILAWCVTRGRYAAAPVEFERGHRGKGSQHQRIRK